MREGRKRGADEMGRMGAPRICLKALSHTATNSAVYVLAGDPRDRGARTVCYSAHVAEGEEGAKDGAHLILRNTRRRPLTHAGGSRGAADLLCRRSIRLSATSRRPAKRVPTRSASTMETEHASATPASSSAITAAPSRNPPQVAMLHV
jgi:hypothetical protein